MSHSQQKKRRGEIPFFLTRDLTTLAVRGVFAHGACLGLVNPTAFPTILTHDPVGGVETLFRQKSPVEQLIQGLNSFVYVV